MRHVTSKKLYVKVYIHEDSIHLHSPKAIIAHLAQNIFKDNKLMK